MSVLKGLFGKKKKLIDDIHVSSLYFVENANRSGYKMDFSLDSMKEVDRFFDEQCGEDGLITKMRGNLIFSIASYIGETIIALYGGEWITDDKDPEGELTIAVKTNKGVVQPVFRCMKRITNGEEDSIYAYVYVLGDTKEWKG